MVPSNCRMPKKKDIKPFGYYVERNGPFGSMPALTLVNCLGLWKRPDGKWRAVRLRYWRGVFPHAWPDKWCVGPFPARDTAREAYTDATSMAGDNALRKLRFLCPQIRSKH